MYVHMNQTQFYTINDLHLGAVRYVHMSHNFRSVVPYCPRPFCTFVFKDVRRRVLTPSLGLSDDVSWQIIQEKEKW